MKVSFNNKCWDWWGQTLFMGVVQALIKPSHWRICDTFKDASCSKSLALSLWFLLWIYLSMCKPCPRSQRFSPALLAPCSWPGTGVWVASVCTRQMGEMNCVRNKCSQPCWAHSLPWLPASLPAHTRSFLWAAPFFFFFLINSTNGWSQWRAEHLVLLSPSSPARLQMLVHGSCNMWAEKYIFETHFS